MSIRGLRLFSILLMGSPAALPSPGRGATSPADLPGTAGVDLASVLDAFLRDHATENPAWRRDIRLGEATAAAPVPDGFSKGHSETAGWYYYRIQNSDTLSPSARREIFRDPRFLAFLSALRDRTDNQRVQAVNLPRTSPDSFTRAEVLARLRARNTAIPEVVNFSIMPAELIASGPLIVAIGAKPPTS